MAGLTTFLKRLRGSLFTTRFETEMEAERLARACGKRARTSRKRANWLALRGL